MGWKFLHFAQHLSKVSYSGLCSGRYGQNYCGCKDIFMKCMYSIDDPGCC